MSSRSVSLLLDDILSAANKIKNYTAGLKYETFSFDEKTVDAVIRNFEIIGEGAKRIPEEYKLLHSDVEWRRIIGFRNRIIHEYFDIDYSIMWEIIEGYLPELIEKINSLKKDDF